MMTGISEYRNPSLSHQDQTLSSDKKVLVTKEGRLVGFYTQRERKQKIRKFKVKIQRWKKKNKYRRVLIGRSQVARLKARLDGKFRTADCKDPTVSQTGFTNGIFSDYEVIRRNKELELFQADKDFNKIVDFAVL